MNSFEELRKDLCIPEVKERNYWFIRTEGGSFFDDFYENGYIAINWEYLTPRVMAKDAEGNIDEIAIKKYIAQKEDLSIESVYSEDEFNSLSEENQKVEKLKLKGDKSRVTSIYNKIYRFLYEFSIGDMVVIPSFNGSHVAIGTITSDIFIDQEYISRTESKVSIPEYTLCPYAKRRHVHWHTKVAHTDLEIFLQGALKPQQAITSLNDYASYLNRNIYSLYTKDNQLHSIFRTFQDGDLTLSQLSSFTSLLMNQIDFVNRNFDDSMDISPLSADDIKIKVNINSPGLIEVVGAGAGALITMGSFISLFTVHKYGGKVTFKGPFGFESSIETSGKEMVALEHKRIDTENRRIDNEKTNLALKERIVDIAERLLEDPNFTEKVEALESLNLKVPSLCQDSECECENDSETERAE